MEQMYASSFGCGGARGLWSSVCLSLGVLSLALVTTTGCVTGHGSRLSPVVERYDHGEGGPASASSPTEGAAVASPLARDEATTGNDATPSDVAATNSHAAVASDENANPSAGEEDGEAIRVSGRAFPNLGIEVLGARQTAAGYLIDVRYRVIDAEKALRWMDRNQKSYMIDESTGAKFYTPSPPKVGPLRQTSRKPAPGRTYFMMFANPGRFIKRGAKVTVVVGDAKVEHLVVE